MANIVNVPSGNFTPGASAALQFSAAMINAAWDQANVKAAAFETKANAAVGELAGGVNDIYASTALTGGPIEPSVTIPSSVNPSDLLATFETQYLQLVELLASKFVSFRTTYFPNEGTTYAAAESWVLAAMQNPNQAIPAAVAAQILSDDRNRAYAEANVLSDAVLAKFAANRFPLPSGAAASAVLQINQKAQDVIADSSRKLMMAYIDQMRFAVDKALNMRQQAMQACVEYIKALASGPEMASRVVGIGYDAQSKLISAASQFYGARIEATKVLHQADQFNVTSKLHADERNQDTDLHRAEERVKALMAEAQALAQMASAMFNNIHASAGTSYSVSGT